MAALAATPSQPHAVSLDRAFEGDPADRCAVDACCRQPQVQPFIRHVLAHALDISRVAIHLSTTESMGES